MASIKHRGREVTKQPQRFLLGGLVIALGVLSVLLAIVTLIVLIPLSLPLHFLVKAFNGRGFTKWNGGHVKYEVPTWASILIVVLIVLLIVVL